MQSPDTAGPYAHASSIGMTLICHLRSLRRLRNSKSAPHPRPGSEEDVADASQLRIAGDVAHTPRPDAT